MIFDSHPQRQKYRTFSDFGKKKTCLYLTFYWSYSLYSDNEVCYSSTIFNIFVDFVAYGTEILNPSQWLLDSSCLFF